MGTSIGANLTIKLARKYPETEGIVLMATPYKIRLEPLTLLFAKTLRLFRRYSKKIYPPTFGSIQTVTRRISYQTYPIDSALETFKLIQSSREDIPGVLQPCFLIQSSSDHIVSSNSLEKLYANIGSQNKKMRYLKRAYHTFISDIKNEHVFEEIFQFIEEN
jgi:esterase/lipase